MAINPVTGLEDDPVLAQFQQAPAAPPLAGPPLLAMAGGPEGKPAGLPPLGVPVPQYTPPTAPPPSPEPPALPITPAPATMVKPTTVGAAPHKTAGPSADQRQLNTIAAGETAATQTMGAAKVAQAGAVAEGKTGEVDARAQQQADEAARLQLRTQEKSKIDAEAAADSDAAKKAGFRGYWADKSSGTKILAAISVALGGLGQALMAKAGRAPGENGALKIINDAIAMDWQKQRESIAKLERQAEKSGADAKHIAAEVSLMEASHRKNALDLAVAQTEQRIAALGPNAAAAATQGALAGLQREQFQAEKALEQQKLQAADLRAGTALKYAEAQHARAQATAALAPKEPKESAKGIVDARQRAMVATGLQDQDRIAKALEVKGVRLSERDLQRIQDNRTYLDATKHDPSAAGAMATVFLRKWGAVPRQEFEGLTAEQKQLAGAYELMSQKAALLASGSQTAEAINHARGLVDLMAPGMGPQETARRRGYIRTDLIGANVGLVPGETAKARAGAEAAAAGELSAAAPRPKLTPEDKTKLVQFIRQNPNDPRAARARSILSGEDQIAAR